MRLYTTDHPPPHVHVVGPGANAKFRIDPLECMYSRGFSKSALSQIERFLRERQDIIQEAWDGLQK